MGTKRASIDLASVRSASVSKKGAEATGISRTTTQGASGPGTSSNLADLLVHEGATLNAELREKMEQQAKTIQDIIQTEVENQKLSKIKDEYKRRNQELLKENAKLQTENSRLRRELASKTSTELDDLNEQVTEREKKVAEIEEQVIFVEDQQKKLDDLLLQCETSFKEELEKTKTTYEDKAKEFEKATKEYHVLMRIHGEDDSVLPTNFQQFLRQKTELFELADTRVNQLKEKQKESEVLKQRIKKLDQTITNLRSEKLRLAKMFPAKRLLTSFARASSPAPQLPPSSRSWHDGMAAGQGVPFRHRFM